MKAIILKYNDLGKSLWAHDEGNAAIDRIKVDYLPGTSFPKFDIETDRTNVIARRKLDGQFIVTIGLKNDTLSYQGLNMRDFLTKKTPNAIDQFDRSFRFIFAIQLGEFTFFGTFKSSEIEQDFTILNEQFYATFYVRDPLQEMAEYADTLNTYFSGIHSTYTDTFEGYMNTHCFDFAPHFYLPNHIGGKTFAQRIGDSSVVFTGKSYAIDTIYTNWRIVSRWETFRGLAQGLGFDYDLELRYTDMDQFYDAWQTIPRELFKLRIFWREDIENETAVTLEWSENHKEITIPKTKKYLFMGYRHAIFTRLPNQAVVPAYTGIRGILYDGINIIDTDSIDNTNPPYPQYNFFLRTTNAGFVDFDPNETLLYIYGNGQEYIYNNRDINEIPLTLYSNPGIGGNVPGSYAYARLFNCTGFNFLPIQRYVIESYKRYVINANKKGKIVTPSISDVPGLRLFKPIDINDGEGIEHYYVNGIKGINMQNRTVELELLQL